MGSNILIDIHFEVSSEYNGDYQKDEMFNGIIDEVANVWHAANGDNTPRVELNFKVAFLKPKI